MHEYEKTPAIVSFFLFWSEKEPKWNKVKDAYGPEQTEDLRREWTAYHG